jgi:serine/threonine protein kinase/formylglycine-generating enzyme required for sulfatase activity
MTLEHCPNPETLAKLLLGDLPASQRERWGEHLLACDRCVATAEKITATDNLTEAIRARRVSNGEDDAVLQVIERGKQLHSEIETVESDVTQLLHPSGGSGSEVREFRTEDVDFLHPPENPDEIGRLGGYRVLEVLGVGGMGVVFRAEDLRLKRHVALKVMKPAVAASRSSRNRFLREAQAAAAIDHDHIVHIYEVDEDRHIPFIAMQYLRGESLQTRLDREGRLEATKTLRIGREIATGLAAAHQQGLIHRDIKPDNIWLEAAGQRVKILDFGLVRQAETDAGLTQSGMVLGTPRYMAPEQAQAKQVDPRCDLFSLGAVLYHVVTGKAPFAGSDLSTTMHAVVHHEPESVDKLCPTLPPDFSALITSLLAKDPAKRPRSAEIVAQTIAEIEQQVTSEGKSPLASDTVTLPVATSIAPKKQRRWPWVAVALAAALLLGVWAAVVILRLETPDGALIVKVTGDDYVASIQGMALTIENIASRERYQVLIDDAEQVRRNLKPGDYQFVLQSDTGLKTKTNRFTIGSGKSTQVEVWWEPKSSQTARSTRNSASRSWQGWPAEAPLPAIAPFDAAGARRYQEAWAKYLGAPAEYVNSLGMKFRLIPPGEFRMGSNPVEIEESLPNAQDNALWQACTKSEGPQHKVVLTKPFYLSEREVTQSEFKRIVGKNPSWFVATSGGRDLVTGLDTFQHPVESVSWNDAADFCTKLGHRENLASVYLRKNGAVTITPEIGYRLPTEAEWEFACRAGTTTKWWTGDSADRLADGAWYGRPEGRPQPVGQLKPNPFGLFDMHGNVYEWVQDWWDPDYYGQFQEQTAVDPTGRVLQEGLRVARGGDWFYSASDARSAARWAIAPAARPWVSAGFRVALPVEAVKQDQVVEPRPQPAEFVEVHGVTPDALQAWAKDLPTGYRPFWIARRAGAPEPLLDAVAIPDPDAWEWELQILSGDTAPKYEEMSQTHRPLLFVTYQNEPNANVRLWIKDPEAWSYWFGDAAFMEEKLTEARAEGVPPSSLAPYGAGDSAGYEVLFGDHAGLRSEWDLDLSFEELLAKLEAYRKAKWRPHIINMHADVNPPRFLAVFVENPSEIAWDFSSSLRESEYESHLIARKAQGFIPQCVCSWVENDTVKYTVIWSQEVNLIP